MERVLLAKVGAFALLAALALPAAASSLSARPSSVLVAAAVDVADQAPQHLFAAVELPESELPFARALTKTDVKDEPEWMASPPPPEPLVTSGIVVASWYGPGFYGRSTACGQTFTPEIAGVAHRLLPCGTQIQITSSAGTTVVVPVIDRGPFVAGRSLDLSSATKDALRCSDLCTVRIVVH